MTIDYDLFRDKLNTLNHEIFKETNEQQVLPVLAIHQILKECEVKEMTDKIKSEDFIKAFGCGVSAKVENMPTKLEVSSPIVIDCKYYLPCGRCDKTNGFCSQLDAIYQQTKPNVTVRTTPNEYSVNPSFYVPVNNDGIKPV